MPDPADVEPDDRSRADEPDALTPSVEPDAGSADDDDERDAEAADAGDEDADGDVESDVEALSWAGDAERGRDSRSGSGTRAGDSEADDETDDEDPELDTPVSTATFQRPGTRGDAVLRLLTVLLAIASSVGWITVSLHNPVQQPSLLGLIMYQLGEFLSIIAAPLGWIVIDRTLARPNARAIGFFVVLVLTAPWPLLIGVLA